MVSYVILDGGFILRDDGAVIPPDEDNIDYLAYMAWKGSGNTAPVAPKNLRSTTPITKTALYAELTDAELVKLETWLNAAAGVRKRLLWATSNIVGDLQELVPVLTKPRVDELRSKLG